MPDPNLVVSLLKPEEAPLYQAIRHETFKHDINKILYLRQPNISQATMDHVIDGIKKGITNDGIRYLKCVDQSTGDVIAGARWQYHGPSEEAWAKGQRQRTQEDVDAELTLPEPYAESDVQAWNQFFTTMYAGKRANMGNRPYYCLDTLVTHPDHHRRGAGSLLVRWGCDKADEKGIECYLEASQMGAPLYERFGFQRLENFGIDLREFGGEEAFEFIMMRRPAQGVKN